MKRGCTILDYDEVEEDCCERYGLAVAILVTMVLT